MGGTGYRRDQGVLASYWRDYGVWEPQGTRPAAVCMRVKATSLCDVSNKAIAGVRKPSKFENNK